MTEIGAPKETEVHGVHIHEKHFLPEHLGTAMKRLLLVRNGKESVQVGHQLGGVEQNRIGSAATAAVEPLVAVKHVGQARLVLVEVEHFKTALVGGREDGRLPAGDNMVVPDQMKDVVNPGVQGTLF